MNPYMFSRRVAVLVDPTETSVKFAQSIEANGMQFVHVKSGLVEHQAASNAVPLETLNYNGNMEELLTELRKYDVEFVVPGGESGVILSDYLASSLALPNGNGNGCSIAKRNKFEMHSLLASRGLSHIRQFITSDLDDAVERVQHTYPVVVKPLEGYGGIAVAVCEDRSALEAAFRRVQSTTFFSKKSDTVLVQNFVEGCVGQTKRFGLSGVELPGWFAAS